MIRKTIALFFLAFLPTFIPTPSDSRAADLSGKGTYIDVHEHIQGVFSEGMTIGPGPSKGNPPKASKPGRGPIGGEKGIAGGTQDYRRSAGNLVSLMDRFGVAKAVIMPPPQIPDQQIIAPIEALLDASSKYPGRLFVLAGGQDLNRMIHGLEPDRVSAGARGDFEKTAIAHLNAGARGFGEMAALHLSFSSHHVFEESPPDHPLFLLLADISAARGVPVDLHMEAVPGKIPLPAGFDRVSPNNPAELEENISGLERLLAHNPKSRIVWQHIGWDNTGFMTPDLLRRLLRAHSNLFAALRVEERLRTMGGELMPNRIVDGQGAIKPEWLAVFEAYPDRFMIGSDEFVGPPGMDVRMPKSLEKTWSMTDRLPGALAVSLGRDNAARVYNLQ